MSTLGLTVRQVRWVNKSFWRNPARAFFSFAFPLIFLVIFTSLLGNGTEHLGSLAVKESTYYVAAMAAFGVIQACYSNIATVITSQRESGILQRTNGTPLPRGAFLGSRVLHAVVVGLLLANGSPAWIEWVAKIFPVRHFMVGIQAGFLGTPFHLSDVAVVAAWGLPACYSPSVTSAGSLVAERPSRDFAGSTPAGTRHGFEGALNGTLKVGSTSRWGRRSDFELAHLSGCEASDEGKGKGASSSFGWSDPPNGSLSGSRLRVPTERTRRR